MFCISTLPETIWCCHSGVLDRVLTGQPVNSAFGSSSLQSSLASDESSLERACSRLRRGNRLTRNHLACPVPCHPTSPPEKMMAVSGCQEGLASIHRENLPTQDGLHLASGLARCAQHCASSCVVHLQPPPRLWDGLEPLPCSRCCVHSLVPQLMLFCF